MRLATGFLFGLAIGVVLALSGMRLASTPDAARQEAVREPVAPAGAAPDIPVEPPPTFMASRGLTAPRSAGTFPGPASVAAPLDPVVPSGDGAARPVDPAAAALRAGIPDAVRRGAERIATTPEPGPAIAAGAEIRVVVHAPPGVGPAEMGSAAAALERAGYPWAEVVRVGFVVSDTHVRYYHAEDSLAAAAIARALSGPARDFTAYRPSPGPGTIEVWLGG